MGEAKQVIARNKKAFHDYFVLDTYEAGLELFGTEIKSIRQGKVNLKDSWCSIDEGQMYAVVPSFSRASSSLMRIWSGPILSIGEMAP